MLIIQAGVFMLFTTKSTCEIPTKYINMICEKVYFLVVYLVLHKVTVGLYVVNA
jgi:hypothetical protein